MPEEINKQLLVFVGFNLAEMQKEFSKVVDWARDRMLASKKTYDNLELSIMFIMNDLSKDQAIPLKLIDIKLLDTTTDKDFFNSLYALPFALRRELVVDLLTVLPDDLKARLPEHLKAFLPGVEIVDESFDFPDDLMGIMVRRLSECLEPDGTEDRDLLLKSVVSKLKLELKSYKRIKSMAASSFNVLKNETLTAINDGSKFNGITFMGHSWVDQDQEDEQCFMGVGSCCDMGALLVTIKAIISDHLKIEGSVRLQICNVGNWYTDHRRGNKLIDDIAPQETELRRRISFPEGFSVVCPGGASIDLPLQEDSLHVLKKLSAYIYGKQDTFSGSKPGAAEVITVNLKVMRQKMRDGKFFLDELNALLELAPAFSSVDRSAVRIIKPVQGVPTESRSTSCSRSSFFYSGEASPSSRGAQDLGATTTEASNQTGLKRGGDPTS